MKNKPRIENLKQAIERLHDCRGTFKEKIWVTESFEDKTVWQGDVFIFDIQGHPKAKICYAWSSPVEGSTRERVYAVLHIPPIESPADAVRAAIASDFKSK